MSEKLNWYLNAMFSIEWNMSSLLLLWVNVEDWR
jgi:hypothetical protein